MQLLLPLGLFLLTRASSRRCVGCEVQVPPNVAEMLPAPPRSFLPSSHCLVSSGRVRTSLCRLAGIARTGRNAMFMCCPGVGLSIRRRTFSSFTENPHQATLVTLRLNCNQHTTNYQSTEHTEQVAGAAEQLRERGLVAKAP